MASSASDDDGGVNEVWAAPDPQLAEDIARESATSSVAFDSEMAREEAAEEYRTLRATLDAEDAPMRQSSVLDDAPGFGDGSEHDAWIEGAKLGMTVENVLERTVVHDVDHGG